MEVFLYREKNLVGVDRLYQIVGNLVPDSLVHNVLLFTFCNHDDRDMGHHELDALQRLQTGESGHVLVKDYQVEVLLVDQSQGIGTAACGDHIVAFAFEEKYMGFQEVDFIIGPKYLCHGGYRGFVWLSILHHHLRCLSGSQARRE